MEKHRLQFESTPEGLAEYNALVDECSLRTKQALQDQLVALFQWAAEESRKGRKIGSFNPDKTEIEAIVIPSLERIRRKALQKPDQ